MDQNLSHDNRFKYFVETFQYLNFSPAPYLFTMQMIVFFLFFAGCALAQAKLYSEACPDFDASKIKMVTFDCFAALMAWEGAQ